MMKDSGVEWLGEIPEHWDVTPFKGVFRLIYRYPTYYGIEYQGSGVIEVRGESLGKDGRIIDLPNARFISDETSSRYPMTRLEYADIVMSVRGTLGKIGYVDSRYVGANITANLIRLSPRADLADGRFLRWLFVSSYFHQCLDAVSFQTTIKTVTVPQLSQIILPLPKKAEQRAIANFLDCQTERIDALIAKKQRQIELLEEKRTALISAAVTGQIDVREEA